MTGAASFALSKVIARERIGTWVREPFVDEEHGRRTAARHAAASRRRRAPHLYALRRRVERLGLVGLRLTSPATGRVVNDVLAVSAMNDWLQTSFKLLCAKANDAASS